MSILNMTCFTLIMMDFRRGAAKYLYHAMHKLSQLRAIAGQVLMDES